MSISIYTFLAFNAGFPPRTFFIMQKADEIVKQSYDSIGFLLFAAWSAAAARGHMFWAMPGSSWTQNS